MVTRISISRVDLKDLFRQKIVYKDLRTGPMEISLDVVNYADMRDMLEEAIDEKFPMRTAKREVLKTGDDD